MKTLLLVPVLALASFAALAQDIEENDSLSRDPLSESGVSTETEGQSEPLDSPEDLSADSAEGEDWVRDFAEADLDGDGFLSAVEARQALPSHVLVVDTDNDGQLSKTEVQNAVPGLSFDDGGEASENSQIGEEEYDAIVQAIEEDGTEQDV